VQVGIPQPMRDVIESLIPVGRPGSPREAAGGIAFLCSPWSDYVSGQVLNVTGGLAAGMAG
jgi:3-oxoacyl-[acyl-carrier protein] reductase